MLGHRNFKLEGTLKFIDIDCKVINIEGCYVMFRVDCKIQIVYFVHEKQKNTSSSIRYIVENKFHE